MPHDLLLRDADADDVARLVAIAVEGGSHDADAAYLGFVGSNGRVTIAERDGVVVGFAGMVPIGDVAMVTDLFVESAARGQGVGGAMLRELLDGWPHRMTCSSQHASALPAYRRAGMEPVGRLLYLDGTATGGGTPLTPEPWSHDRDELVAHFAVQGAVVAGDVVVQHVDAHATILRLHHPDPVTRVREVVVALPARTVVRAHVPSGQRLATQLVAEGFVVVDHDVICATPGLRIPDACSCVHAGLF